MKDGESITLTTTKNKRKQGVSETLFLQLYTILHFNLQAVVGKKYIFGQIVLGFFVKTYLVCKVC